MENSEFESGPPADAWSEAVAQSLVGKVVLVGITYLDATGELDRQQQMFGVVAEAVEGRGIRLALSGAHAGTDYWLPPQTSNLFAAEPSVYRLRSTGEEVEDPDFVTSWTIHRNA